MVIRQRIFLAATVVVNATLWAVPSNVIELIARNRPTLLGRYSREHFTLNVAVLIATIIGLYIDQAKPEQYKKRWFQVIAALLFLMPSIAILDFGARMLSPQRYVKDSVAYHRQPNVSFTAKFIDRPAASLTYPNASAGYEPVTCEYHTDDHGYRNATTQSACDVVVLGDSFAEGSKVSDGHPWPVLLAKATNLTVCNLGMSGYAPAQYLASLEEYGLSRSPSIVLCMIYEGNDFRGGKPGQSPKSPPFAKRLKTYMKQSPVLRAIDQLFIRAFGSVGTSRRIPGIDILDWLPLAIPKGPSAKHYAFAPKQLLQSRVTADQFQDSPRWQSVAKSLTEMKQRCDDIGATLMIVFAPTKAHVTLPLVAQRVPAEKVRAFASLRAKNLPPAGEFLKRILASLSARETVVQRWCVAQNVPFISTTAPLRNRAATGTQVYYTYDQHWTPEGHEVVAQTVRPSLEQVTQKPRPETD